jgi:cytoskeletal protein CcmA (bactofilin family)
MFSSGKKSTAKKPNVQSSRVDTLIGVSTNISGNINATGIIRVDGNYTGDITTESEVIIGEGGLVKGDIKAQNVSVSGSIEGNIKCSGVLEILPTGNLVGDIETNNLSISEGAVFNGKCSMISQEIKQIAESSEVLENEEEN